MQGQPTDGSCLIKFRELRRNIFSIPGLGQGMQRGCSLPTGLMAGGLLP